MKNSSEYDQIKRMSALEEQTIAVHQPALYATFAGRSAGFAGYRPDAELDRLSFPGGDAKTQHCIGET